MKKKALPPVKSLEVIKDGQGTSYLVRDLRNPGRHIEVWKDKDDEVWIRQEDPVARRVDIVLMDIGMATDLLGALNGALFDT